MIHNWFNAKRNKSAGKRDQQLTTNRFGDFEQLEDKRCLAFLGFFDGITLDIVQTADDGDVLIENSTGVWRATDNLDTFTFVNAQNVTVSMLDNTANRVDVGVELEHLGDIELFLGDGVRQAFFVGALNEIGGDLNIIAGDDQQEIRLQEDVGAAMIVHGDANIELGLDADIVMSNDTLVTIDGDLTMSGVNDFQYSLFVGLPGPPITGGNVTIDNSMEDEASFMTPGAATILGDFTYTGGVNIDRVDLGGSGITGDVTIDLGIGQPFFGDPQLVEIAGNVDGDVNITAGDSNLGNEINLLGTFNGNIVSYTGGDLVDTVVYSFVGPQADVFAILGAGDDTFELNEQVNLLEIDYNNDLGDLFINNVAPVDFNFEFDITNFHWFDHFYTALNDTLVMNQLADTGNIVIDNDGGPSGFDWRMFPALGGMSSTVGAENLIVTMLPNTGNDVNMDLFNPVIASIELNLDDGARLVEFTGIANNPLRDITITAGAGDQHVDLSVNSPLGVASLNVDLGTGFDTVDDNANSLIVDEDLILVGVNHFEHDGLLSVVRDVVIDTTGEVEDSLFATNGSFFVGDNFTYNGGDGQDELRLNGLAGTEITNAAVINLGASVGGLTQTVHLDGPDVVFNDTLMISSSSVAGTDSVVTNTNTVFNDDLTINLGGGTNDALLTGGFFGNNVAYTGGAGVDTVVYGLAGNDALLSIDLGGGDDSFELLAGATVASPLTIDFGGGTDTFTNSYGQFDFNANLLNLNGFNHIYNLGIDTLTSTQVSDPGVVTVDNNGLANSIQFMAGITTSSLTPVTHMTINMLDGTSDLNIDLDNSHTGNLAIDLGNGNRDLDFIGLDNSIGGNLTVTAGSGDQSVGLAVNAEIVVSGDAVFDMGAGLDEVDENGNNTLFASHLTFLGVNSVINNAQMIVGGDLLFDNSADFSSSVFIDASPLIVAGDFTYLGNDGTDLVSLDPTTQIGGNVYIDAGNGDNTAVLRNVFGGTSVTYLGGADVDDVTFGMTGIAPLLTVNLGSGDDAFTLEAGAGVLDPLVIDFGPGADTFTNAFGVFTFDAELYGLNGFDHIYSFAGASLVSTQVEDVGPITVDDNGAFNSIRFINGGTSTLTPVDHLTLNMLDGNNDLTVDLDNGLAGDLSVDLGNGTRALNLTGSNNGVGGNLTINAGTGSQTAGIAVNNALSVGGDLSVSLGADGDVVDENGNNITVAGHASFSQVNEFLNDGTMNVGGNLDFTATDGVAMDSFSTTAGSFVGGDISIDLGDGSNTANIIGVLGGSNVTYQGGSGVDDVTFGTTGSPADVMVDLGAGDDTFTLLAGAAIDPTTLTVDFGGGNDVFVNLYGDFDFNANLWNLNGFNHQFDLGTDTLVSTQVGDSSPVTVDNNGVGGAIRFLDGTTSSLMTVTSLFITMSDNFSTDLGIDFDVMFNGDLTIDLGDQSRDLQFTGTDNTIDGNVSIAGGSGSQIVELAVNSGFAVTGDFMADLGIDFDVVDEDANNIDIGGNFSLYNVNSFVNDGGATFGGNVDFDASADNQNAQFVDNAIMDIFGGLTYLGGDSFDIFQLNSTSSVGGDVNIDGGNGDNVAIVRGTFGGTEINYDGGSDMDNVTVGTIGNPADLNVKLGLGDDSFTLDSGTAITPNALRVDFGGGGDDTFTSNYGAFDFNAQLLNLDGYNAFFDLGSGNIDIVQVSDSGDVTVTNNGPGSAIQFGSGTLNTISPANDLRLILLSNTSTNVTADFDNARVGNTVIQLRSGDRDVHFTGDSNTYTGLLRVEASEGIQNVNVAVNAPLTLDGTLVVNGRDGNDTVSADAAVNVTGAMLLRGVNNFVNNHGVNVAGDFNVITLLEDQATRLISNNTFMVGGNLSYLGGGGVDAINFKTTGATIGGFTYIDIDDSTDAINKQRISLTGGFSTDNLVVDGSTAVAGNVFTTDSMTQVTNDVIVNFVSSSPNNTALFYGNYGGTYGTYRGGSSSDYVVFGATANNMLFAALTAAGDDTFTIDPAAWVDFLYVDFGPGTDFLDNQLGDPLPFGNNIFNN